MTLRIVFAGFSLTGFTVFNAASGSSAKRILSASSSTAYIKPRPSEPAATKTGRVPILPRANPQTFGAVRQPKLSCRKRLPGGIRPGAGDENTFLPGRNLFDLSMQLHGHTACRQCILQGSHCRFHWRLPCDLGLTGPGRWKWPDYFPLHKAGIETDRNRPRLP